ncbi:carbohydrate binding-domain-containing protein [Podospora conica]|nr:carbohydrate binding-domain-containing protein [Schizothecium conicum]
MVRSSLLVALATATTASVALETCGQAQYDPTQYTCHASTVLCPILAGEPLSLCSGACYSSFQYTCTAPPLSALSLLPPVPQGTPFSLVVSNPSLPALHGAPVTASGLRLHLGGRTATYCPEVAGAACESMGLVTAFVSYNGLLSMNTMVPGGQQAYFGPAGEIGYTQAHSASMPKGSRQTGFGAYLGGGLVDIGGGGLGWAACPPTQSSGRDGWGLVARGEGVDAKGCTPVNLEVKVLEKGASAWQYT